MRDLNGAVCCAPCLPLRELSCLPFRGRGQRQGIQFHQDPQKAQGDMKLHVRSELRYHNMPRLRINTTSNFSSADWTLETLVAEVRLRGTRSPSQRAARSPGQWSFDCCFFNLKKFSFTQETCHLFMRLYIFSPSTSPSSPPSHA